MRVKSDLIDKRAVGERITNSEQVFEMRSGWVEPASVHQGSTGRQVTQNEPDGIIALSTEMQQIFVQAQRQIEFATVRVIARQPERDLNKLRGRT